MHVDWQIFVFPERQKHWQSHLLHAIVTIEITGIYRVKALSKRRDKQYAYYEYVVSSVYCM